MITARLAMLDMVRERSTDLTGAFGGAGRKPRKARNRWGSGDHQAPTCARRLFPGGSARKHGLGADLLRQTRLEGGELG